MTLPEEPLITCAITAFNAEKTIEAAIESASKQTYSNIEILVVDDCSTDGTIDVIKRLTKLDRRIRLICQRKNSGVAAARNTLIRESKGQYIAFFDDDDASEPERVGKQYALVKSFERTMPIKARILCHSARLLISEKNEVVVLPLECLNSRSSNAANVRLARALLGTTNLRSGESGSTATCSQFAAKDTYLSVGGFDRRFRRIEDCEFAVRAAMAGASFIGIREPLITQAATIASEKSVQEQLRYSRMLLEKHQHIAGSKPARFVARALIEVKFAVLGGSYLTAVALVIICTILRPWFVSVRVLRAIRNKKLHSLLRTLHSKEIGS